jgi:glycosyltransferase involved in cell wall biosynthesis
MLGGTSSNINATLKVLRPRGLNPIMLFREPGPWQRELEADGIPCYFDSLRVPDKHRPVRSFLDVWKLIRLVRRERVDLIHVNEHQDYPLFRLVARWTGIPTVVTLHWNLEPGFGRWAFRAPYRPACLQFLSQAQLDVSRGAWAPDLAPEQIKLLLGGMCMDDFLARDDRDHEFRSQWGVDAGTVVVGIACAMKPRKRLEDFVRLIGMLRQRGLNVLGVVAGGGPFTDPAYEERIVSLIRQHRLEQHCRLLGFVHPLTPFFRAIDICVHTSEMEILSMSLCEAMACRKPTVAYDVGGNREEMPDAWCVAPPGDFPALVEKVARLVNDEPFRLQLGAAAERHVRTYFDASPLAARQAAIYDELLGCRFGLAAPVLSATTACAAVAE